MPQISWFTPSLKCFSSDPDSCPSGGDRTHPPRAGPVLLTPVFPPSSFVLPSFARVYIFLSTGKVLLSALSWHSAHTSVSEAVFLMHPWREMYSTSTYSFTILFSPYLYFILVLHGNGIIVPNTVSQDLVKTNEGNYIS